MNFNTLKKELKLIIRSKLAELSLINKEATLITGSVRSGTTLALRIFCPDLTPEEEKDKSIFNEYGPFTNQIIRGKTRRASRVLPIILAKNRLYTLKSPHLAFLLPDLPPRYRVIVTFRDLRMVVPSMLRHRNVQRILDSAKPYWAHYINQPLPQDPISQAILVAKEHYLHAVQYRGPIELWNYGYWDEWHVKNHNTKRLYSRKAESSEAILHDIQEGKIFSDKMFNLDSWKRCCKQNHISLHQLRMVEEAHKEIKRKFEKKGIKIKLFEENII
jgi:hypothetical protein